MHDDVQVYDHAVLSPHARRLLVVLAAVAALVLGLVTPAHAANGQLSGTVTGAGSGPLEDVEVDVYEVLSGNDYDFIDATFTDASGAYTVVLAPGTYVIDFWPGDGVHIEEMYDDVPGFDLDGATRVVVGDGATVHADAELTRTASISGNVTDAPADAPIVLAYDQAGQVVGYGFVEGNGGSRSTVSRPAAPARLQPAERIRLLRRAVLRRACGGGRARVRRPGDARLGGGPHRGGRRTGRGRPPHRHAARTPTATRCGAGSRRFTANGSLVTRSGTSDPATGIFDISGLTTGSYLVRVVNGNGCQNGIQFVGRGPRPAERRPRVGRPRSRRRWAAAPHSPRRWSTTSGRSRSTRCRPRSRGHPSSTPC